MESGTVFLIAITTARMILPGMPALPNIGGLANLNAPMRTMTMDLTSEKTANAQSKAECAVPSGMKLGPKVDLTIYLPEKGEAEPVEMPSDGEETRSAEFKLLAYWGCSETVKAGQPRTVDFQEMDKAMREAMKSKDFKAQMSKAYKRLTRDDESHAYWPGRDSRTIAKDAASPGDYKLSTNYCGGTSFTLDKSQDFLAAIDLVSPGKKIDFGNTIKVEWKSVPNAVGYVVYAFSGREKEMITWTSSSDPDVSANLQTEPLSSQKVAQLIKDGILLPPTTTECTIPSGIFKETGNTMLTVIALGHDKSQNKDGIATNVVIRSNAMVTLGSMGMPEQEQMEEPTVEEDDIPADSEPVEPAVQPDQPAGEQDKVKDAVDRVKKIFKR